MARGEGVKKLSHLFEKYTTSLIAPERTVINTCIEVVDDLYGWKLERSHFAYSPHTKILSITTSGPLKTELLLHKPEILEHLKGRLGVRSAPKDLI